MDSALFVFFEMTFSLLLGSQSPRRRELLNILGVSVLTLAADADEDSIQASDPVAYVLQTALLKTAVLRTRLSSHPHSTNYLLTADTTVACDGHLLNKPVDQTAAWKMLTLLRNRQHSVHTAYVLTDLQTGKQTQRMDTAVVTMRNYSDNEIAAYIATGDPMDKAGAYAIQHAQFQPVWQLEGCFLTVMGLPLCDLIVTCTQLGLPIQPDLDRLAATHQGYHCPQLSHI
jgi:septum formation protein